MSHVEGFHLERTDENVDEIEKLAGMLGGRVGLDGLLDDLKYKARRSLIGRFSGRAVREAYTWDRYDRKDRRWWPQGISTSADASDDEVIHGRRMLVTTWYSHRVGGVGHGSRVTFLDLETLKYRHVLLVVPTLDAEGRLQLEPLKVHAGGIAWCGPYLHIAATAKGLMTCRVDDIMRVPGDNERPDEFGVDGERIFSYGHHYVLPVRFSYQAFADEGNETMRYSFLSLDRKSDPPSLLAGEYGLGRQTTRLARFELDRETWLLRTGDDGFSRPLFLDDISLRQMQGVVIARGRYHVTVSQGHWHRGSVFVGEPGRFTRRRYAVPMGPEDITYWPSTDRLWSLSEHPFRRWIVSMERSWFD